ncbi:hypothetical protein BVRB_5g104010 [Beta vulgaris subsp. vulgaris]|nr:hypothetical protein BVRB_5g104010 [Beta vulgaris subsp. vulgaris]
MRSIKPVPLLPLSLYLYPYYNLVSPHKIFNKSLAGELQPAIRTEDGFLGLAHPRGQPFVPAIVACVSPKA